MAKNLNQINAQIAKLQQQADALRAKEKAAVVARISEAIEHYGITAADLFSKAAGKPTRAKRASTKAKAKPAGVVRFRGPDGQTWTGVGKRPQWYRDLEAAGTPPKDLKAAQ